MQERPRTCSDWGKYGWRQAYSVNQRYRYSARCGIFYYAGWADRIAYAVRVPKRGFGCYRTDHSHFRGHGCMENSSCACRQEILSWWNAEQHLPLAALKLAEIIQEADLLRVMNIVTGAEQVRIGEASGCREPPDPMWKDLTKAIAGTKKKIYTWTWRQSLAGEHRFEDATLDQAVEESSMEFFFNRRTYTVPVPVCLYRNL